MAKIWTKLLFEVQNEVKIPSLKASRSDRGSSFVREIWLDGDDPDFYWKVPADELGREQSVALKDL